jgi:hypothetical protein
MAVTSANVSGTFKTVTDISGNVSGTWKSVDEGYANVSGNWKTVFIAFQATSFITVTGTSTTTTVPTGANAIHIQAAVGGGGGAAGGADYDKAGGESAGAGGGSGAYVSDKIFSVVAGETLTLIAGTGGAAGNQLSNFKQPRIADAGTSTSLSGSTTGSIFTLTGGGGSSGINGGVQGPLRTNIAGTAGSATISGTVITSGSFNQSGVVVSVSTCTGGPVGTFNQSGNGADGVNPGNCGGDNCQIGGGNGGASYAGNISGGTGSPTGGPAGTAGNRGSGGGGGGAQWNYSGQPNASTDGAIGGNGEIQYRFLRVS